MNTPVIRIGNAEKDADGNEFLSSEKWSKMVKTSLNDRPKKSFDYISILILLPRAREPTAVEPPNTWIALLVKSLVT
jgi:hypothetical protein